MLTVRGSSFFRNCVLDPWYRTGFIVPKRIGSRPRYKKFVRKMYTLVVPYFFQPPTLVPRSRSSFPPYRKHGNYVLDMNAAVCSASATSIAVVAWFPWTHVVIGAEAGRPTWEVLHRGLFLRSILPFQGRLYATVVKGGSRKIMQLYPRSPHPVLAHVPNNFGDPSLCNYFLVESGGRVLLAIHHLTAQHCGVEPLQQNAYKLFALDIDRGELIPVNCLGGHALFLSRDRSLSVSARDLPSVNSNSIYFSLYRDPVVVHSVRTGFSERLALSCQIHDGKDRIRPSVRPFTIADQLLTYCHPHEALFG